ncbi:acetylornithine deacetylase/succinyl-diaminopimelate desuccinylase-like protein [Fructobacillus pseudoficulneus]|uniref:Acetylornithine deacetylase/succinyl-diaminopimelate desuccinylase-like protein n=1 Tax=Fructobacillus pseudoficulneus TaxID=220714 RepID=A0A3F3HAE9_9LACO|nr:M20/M25/M40 family metallo-hydrolase [Fructobacillus pseudoficulneus]GAP03093.1 acetylornithine deacetylase/succinyl-diaminopimelate desuccinylase-like protein [Fructobacillus pseudoficulneus]SEH41473.1 Acetylornithine deacetylase/Succinyl-diaminopimelate desuccinylase [Fructobacillus pseudoficulneus]
MNREKFDNYVNQHLTDYFPYLALESISTQNKNIPETAAWLQEQFDQLGATETEVWHDQGANPVVYAYFKGNSDKTVLFYNHYDVQPSDPLPEWHTDPFQATVKDDKIYARGICDDKGELISRLTVVKYFMENGGLPVNLKFFVEGAEEIGSPKVGDYVKAHQDKLTSDVCIWEGGGKDENEDFQITCGLKGIIAFDLEVTTAARDIHSSLAAYAPNAAWRLVQALNSMKSFDGDVLVDGFYDEVKELPAATQNVVQETTFNRQKAIENAGIKAELVSDQPEYDLVNGTTMTINGLSSGYQGAGVKTIIPKTASAKVDCRLVPDQDPDEIFDLVRKHLDRNGFNDIKLTKTASVQPFRTNLDDSFVKLAQSVANEVYGDHVALVPNMAGGGPAFPFYDVLNDAIIMVGVHYAGSGPHAPNEHIRIQDFVEGSAFMAELLEHYSRTN